MASYKNAYLLTTCHLLYYLLWNLY